MRIIGVLLALAFVALGGFLFLGYNEPEFDFQNGIDIAAPVEQTWIVFHDPERMPLWLSGFVKIEYLRGEPAEVGSYYRLTFKEGDREMVMTEQITRVEENERFGMNFETGMMTADTLVTFQPIPQGTRIASETTVRGKGIFWQSMLLWYRDEMQSRQQGDLERLKGVVENL